MGKKSIVTLLVACILFSSMNVYADQQADEVQELLLLPEVEEAFWTEYEDIYRELYTLKEDQRSFSGRVLEEREDGYLFLAAIEYRIEVYANSGYSNHHLL